MHRASYCPDPEHDLESALWALGAVVLCKLRVIAHDEGPVQDSAEPTTRRNPREVLGEITKGLFGLLTLDDLALDRTWAGPLRWIQDHHIRDFLFLTTGRPLLRLLFDMAQERSTHNAGQAFGLQSETSRPLCHDALVSRLRETSKEYEL